MMRDLVFPTCNAVCPQSDSCLRHAPDSGFSASTWSFGENGCSGFVSSYQIVVSSSTKPLTNDCDGDMISP